MKTKNKILLNYILMFLITTLVAMGSFLIFVIIFGSIEKSFVENRYTAPSLMKDDYNAIEYEDVVSNSGGIQVVNSSYQVIYTKGINNFPKSQLTATELTDFLSKSNSPMRNYSYSIAYNENEDFWLIITFPTSIRIDLSLTYNSLYASPDKPAAIWVIVLGIFIYALMLIICTIIYSRMTAQSFTRPLSMLQESASRLSKGDYKSRVNLNLRNEFGDLERSFNNMAQKIEEEIELRKQSENSRRQLTLDIAHDLKNPLAIVMGYAEYCLNHSAQVSEQYLNLIYQNSNRANSLVTSLFELSKLENSEYVLNKTKTDIAEYLRIKVADTMSTIESSGLLYDYDLPDGEIFVNLDEKEMNRVIDNLIENAMRYNDKGTKIKISLIEYENHCEIIVEDNGKGIAPELTDKIFMPFVRADEARNSETGGSGLGLAIADKIIKMHDGNISLISDIGNGCKFTIKLPKI
jgi:signal transduction histidine kinase